MSQARLTKALGVADYVKSGRPPTRHISSVTPLAWFFPGKPKRRVRAPSQALLMSVELVSTYAPPAVRVALFKAPDVEPPPMGVLP